MASQTIDLGITSFSGGAWEGAVLLDAALVAGGGVAYLRYIAVVGPSIQVRLALNATDDPSGAGPEFAAVLETAAAVFTFRAGSDAVVLKGPNHPDNAFQDPTDPYFWSPDNGTQWNTFALSSRTDNIVLTLNDGLPESHAVDAGDLLWTFAFVQPTVTHSLAGALVLADFDQTDLQVDLLALIVAGLDISGDNRSYYADSNRPPVVGSLVEGELGISATESLVSRFQYIFQGSNAGQIRLNDDDVPAAFSWSDYFAGDGADLTFYVQTANRLVSVPIAGNIASSGGGFVRISIPDAIDQAAIGAIEDGDRFIFAFARAPQSHAVDAGDLSWTFAFVQPTVTLRSGLSVDAGNLSWTFAFVQPTVTLRSGLSVDAGNLSWTFAFVQPTVTLRIGNTLVREFDTILADPFSTNEELAMEYWAALPFSQIDVSAYKDLLNPLRCPIAFLPELADLLQAYTWAPFMPEAYQRRSIADWWYYYRFRTTQAALRRWMETVQSLYSLEFTEGGSPTRKESLTVNMSDTPLVPVNAEVRQWEIDTVRRILGWPFMIDPINVIFANTYVKTLRIGMGMTIKHFKGW